MSLALLLILAAGCGASSSAPAAHETVPPDAQHLQVELPTAVMPHCLYGLDPHDKAVRPYDNKDGKGYRLNPPRRSHALALAGFLPKDSLRSVNGNPVGTAETTYQARKAIEGATQCSWVIRRDAEDIVIDATLRQTPTTAPDVQQTGPHAWTVSRAYALRFVTNPYGFKRHIKVQEQPDDGLIVVDRRVLEFLESLGMDPTDVLLTVANTPLHSDVDLIAALERFLTDDTITWIVSHEGQPLILQYQMRGAAITLPPVESTSQSADAGDDRPPPETPTRRMGAVPIEEDGVTIGYRLSGVTKDSPFRRMGIHNGDILTAINGQPLTSAEVAQAIAAQLADTSELVLSLRRRGEPVELRIPIKD